MMKRLVLNAERLHLEIVSCASVHTSGIKRMKLGQRK